MYAMFLCMLDDLHTSVSGAVAQMQMCSGLSCQHHIPHGDNVLNGIADTAQSLFADVFVVVCHTAVHKVNVLAVCHNRNPALCCDLHCFLAEQGIHNRFAILADRRGTFCHHRRYIGKFLSFLSFCDRSCLQHMDRCIHLCFVVYIADIQSVIRHWLCIWHRQYCRKSSVCCCHRSCLNCFLISLSRISQMNMQVDQTRHHVTAVCIDHFVCLFFYLLLYFYDLILLDQDIIPAIFSGVRIDHSAVFNQYTHLSDSFL